MNPVDQKTKEMIREICLTIEKEENVKILFAIENGSRAWRIHSQNSDYDVRFVFTHPVTEYLKLEDPKKVITRTFDSNGKPCPPEGAHIDITGFDIFKFGTLLSQSNPTTIEWLISDIIYVGEQNPVFKSFAEKSFNPIALFHHLQSMVRENYNDGIQKNANVTIKRYLYCARGIVNSIFVEQGMLAPISFQAAIEQEKNQIPLKVYENIQQMIQLKKSGIEKTTFKRIPELDEWIEQYLTKKPIMEFTRTRVNDAINDEIQRILLM